MAIDQQKLKHYTWPQSYDKKDSFMVHLPVGNLSALFASVTILKLGLAKSMGLNLSQYMAITLLGANQILSVKELKEALDMPGSSVTFTMDSLEEKGFIVRERSRRDRRQWHLKLTHAGQSLYQQVVQAEKERTDAVLDGFGDNERQVFLKIVEGLTGALSPASTR